MKKSVLFSLVIVSTIVVLCCNKVKSLLNIEINVPFSQSIEIPAMSVYDTVGLHYFPSAGVHYSSALLPVATGEQNFLTNYKTDTNLIDTFSMVSLTLLDSPSTASFSYMDTAQVYICLSANDSTLIASKYGTPNFTLDSLVMDVNSNVNLRNYFLRDSFYFKFSGHFVSLPPNGLQQITVNAVMHIGANPLN
jgi:hypothetical protein